MPLRTVANKRLYRSNPFRITGLAVDASVKDITGRTDKLKMHAELGSGEEQQPFAFALTPAPTIDQVREASQTLKDPEKRMIYTFFWFWPDVNESGRTDPALKALERGDHGAAFEIWLERENDQKSGHIAKHNLAVMFHLLALDWTHYQSTTSVTAEKGAIIETYWQEATTRWSVIASDDRTWETVREQVRILHDAGVQTGIARRMAGSIRSAIGQIHAEVALQFAEKGEETQAKTHLQLLKKTNTAPNEAAGMIEKVLAPKKELLQHQTQQAIRTDPKDGYKTAKELIDQATPYRYLFGLFYKANDHRVTELFDEVAEAANRAIIAYQNSTGNNHKSVEILEKITEFANNSELKERITRNIQTGRNNILFHELTPLFDRLKEIAGKTASPKAKLTLIQTEIVQAIQKGIWQRSDAEPMMDLLYQTTVALRDISIQAFNEFDDVTTAEEACSMAISVCRDVKLLEILKGDKSKLRELKKEEASHNVKIKIRGDTIVIDKTGVRYNEQTISAEEICGIKFGIFRQYTNGVQSSCSYRADFLSSTGRTINIECKRFFRSEVQANEDYKAIIGAALYHLAPKIVTRVVRGINEGKTEMIGSIHVTKHGAIIPTGILAWKKDNHIPLSRVGSCTYNGELRVGDLENNKVASTVGLRDGWNAVIFEPIIKAICAFQNK